MSWDNVKGVSAAQVWTDNPDMTQAYLFANGNHQVKLTVAISFTLTNTTQPGPTEDEVKAALSLIDFDTGAGLSHLKAGDKGKYSYVYLPSMPTAIKAIETTDTGSYQYEFDYYLSTDNKINADYGSEKVALFLSYTNASGSKVEYSTASGNKSQSYVAVIVYPPQKYGMNRTDMTPIIFGSIEKIKSVGETGYNNVFSTVLAKDATTYGLRIDDAFFRISGYETVDTPVSPTAFLQDRINDFSQGDDYHYEVGHGYLCSENKLNSGHVAYTSKLYLVTENNVTLVGFHVDVNQNSGILMFVRLHCDISYVDDGNDGPILNSGGQAKLIVFDQFGNPANIEIDNDGDGYLKLSSVS